MTDRASLFDARSSEIVEKYVTTRVGQIPEAVGKLLAAYREAQDAIGEWLEAEEAFSEIGIEGFDKPPYWYAAKDRCVKALGRLSQIAPDHA